MKYRPDIDGLRAVAIILVLIYHGGLTLFPSGFIGVDVFFVISGFLITTIIHHAMENKSFSFADFYTRRLWRLQPVFVCFIVITSIATIVFYLPEDLILYYRSARKTSLFISNQFFNHTTTGYFATNNQQLPLLHTWSLSIEWQCYLILPLLLYALNRVLKFKQFVLALYALTILSFIVAMRSSQLEPNQTYYLFSSRIFEFLIGSCIAIQPMSHWSANQKILNISGIIALCTLFYIASIDQILIGYPNVYSLMVCLATAALIIIGSLNKDAWTVRMLSIKPIVFIGLLSYSLYIWHWAIFAILRYETVDESTFNRVIIYLVIFLTAFLSWKYIEKPSRQFKNMAFKPTVLILIILPITLIHLTSYTIKAKSGLPSRFNEEVVNIYNELTLYQSDRRPLCISNSKTDIYAKCNIGSTEANSKKGLMIGDSFSNHYWGFMDVLGKASRVSILAHGTSSCITLPGLVQFDWWYFKNKIYKECREQTDKYYQMIRKNHYDYVIIGQLWINYVDNRIINNVGDKRSMELTYKRLSKALDDALNIITSSGAKPILMKSTAIMPPKFHTCFFKHIKRRQPYNAMECSFHLERNEKQIWLDNLFDKMKIKYPQLVVIDPKKIQCEHGMCKADFNGIPIYRDEGHITDYASYQLGTIYNKKYKNPFV